jgi:hypothetical protein
MRANLKQKGPVLGERLYRNMKVARHSFVTVTTYDSLGGWGWDPNIARRQLLVLFMASTH